MRDTTRNHLVLGIIIVAVGGIMIFNRGDSHKLAEQLPDDSVIGQGKPVLLQLGAHWCPPCRKQLPVMVELGNKRSPFLTAFLDVDEHPDKARSYGASSIPVLIFFDADGHELFRHVGFYPREGILAKWTELGMRQ